MLWLEIRNGSPLYYQPVINTLLRKHLMRLLKPLFLFAQNQKHIHFVCSIEEVDEAHLPVLIVALLLFIPHLGEPVAELVDLVDDVVDGGVHVYWEVEGLVEVDRLLGDSFSLGPVWREREAGHDLPEPVLLDPLFLDSEGCERFGDSVRGEAFVCS